MSKQLMPQTVFNAMKGAFAKMVTVMEHDNFRHIPKRVSGKDMGFFPFLRILAIHGAKTYPPGYILLDYFTKQNMSGGITTYSLIWLSIRMLGTFSQHLPMILSNTYWLQSNPTSLHDTSKVARVINHEL